MELTIVINAVTNLVMDKTLVVVVGPTAIGKTSLAIRLAKHFDTDILSSDSRQFYKEMSIGTAVPSKDELEAVPHHFIQNLSVKDDYTVGDFERDALKTLDELFIEKDLVIMVGGSGLYIDAVTNGLDNFPEVDSEIRKRLMLELNEKGIEYLQNQLKQLDPEYYETSDIQNPHRLVRALEICLGTGKTYSSFRTGNKQKRKFNSVYIGLTGPRDEIYNRINTRVDEMIKNGLIEEARSLLPFKNLNALNTVGYKEIFSHLDNEVDLETAISEIKKNTRRYAKRQLTWLKKNNSINWFPYTEDYENIISFLETLVTHAKT